MAPKRKAPAADAPGPKSTKTAATVSIPPDEHVTAQKSGCAVHSDCAYLANQVDITGNNNNNKYYRGQVLSSGGTFYAWTRWGTRW